VRLKSFDLLVGDLNRDAKKALLGVACRRECAPRAARARTGTPRVRTARAYVARDARNEAKRIEDAWRRATPRVFLRAKMLAEEQIRPNKRT
jgi:hypothetical protein